MIGRRLIIAVTLFIAMQGWSCADDSMVDKAGKMYKEATSIAMSGDIETAIGMFREIIRIDPNYPGAHRALAICYRMTGKGNEAVGEMETAVALAPKDASNYLDLGHICLEQKKWEKAVEQLNKLWELDFKTAKQLEGDILIARGQKLELGNISNDGSAVMVSPKKIFTQDEIKAARLLQEAVGSLKDLNADSSRKAQNLIKEAIILDPGKNVYYLYLARIYANEKDYQKALSTLESYLKQHPDDAQTVYMLAGILCALGRYGEAIETYEKIKEMDEVIYSISKYWIKKAKEAKLRER